MGLLTFKGGIHPNDGKSLAKDKAIVTVMPKGDLIYPLSQHIGAPASPIVSVGDHVLKGQKIAEAGGFVSAPIHASVSGTVKAIELHFNPTGSKVNCIVVENDGEYQEVEYTPSKPLDELTKEEILRITALYRFILPKQYIRLAAGRNYLPDSGFSCFKSGANATITGNMLTVKGISMDEDIRTIKEMGYKVI